VAGHAAAAAAHWRQQRGRAPSLDEMSEEDVLFDANSQVGNSWDVKRSSRDFASRREQG
jgi:hypothetical protein